MVKRAASFALTVTLGLVFAIAAITGIELAKWVEHHWFPVVTDFKIEQAVHMQDGDSVVIKGSMKKVRDCRFIEVVGLSGEVFIEIKFMDRVERNSRPQGVQDFGPWRITPDANGMKLQARHQCHSLWTSTTVLFEGEL